MIPPSQVGQNVIDAMIETASQTPAGCFVEVGVFQGGTAYYLDQLSKEQGRKLYLYDTFEGIPHKDEVDTHKVGDFSQTSYESIKELFPDANVIKGVFPGTCLEMGPIAFVHLDCDQYQSYKEAILCLIPKMVKGGVMWFDDSPCLAGAHKAVTEIFGDRVNIYAGKHYVRL